MIGQNAEQLSMDAQLQLIHPTIHSLHFKDQRTEREKIARARGTAHPFEAVSSRLDREAAPAKFQ